MSFTYDPTLTTILNDVRLLIGDTDEDAVAALRLEDEEITRLVTLFGSNTHRVAAHACEALAAKFLRKPEGTQGNTGNVMPTDRVTHLRRRARELRSFADGAAIPTAGGLSVAARAAALADTDRVAPAFQRGQLDDQETRDTPYGTPSLPQ